MLGDIGTAIVGLEVEVEASPEPVAAFPLTDGLLPEPVVNVDVWRALLPLNGGIA